jgi:hypothetical protein
LNIESILQEKYQYMMFTTIEEAFAYYTECQLGTYYGDWCRSVMNGDNEMASLIMESYFHVVKFDASKAELQAMRKYHYNMGYHLKPSWIDL